MRRLKGCCNEYWFGALTRCVWTLAFQVSTCHWPPKIAVAQKMDRHSRVEDTWQLPTSLIETYRWERESCAPIFTDRWLVLNSHWTSMGNTAKSKQIQRKTFESENVEIKELSKRPNSILPLASFHKLWRQEPYFNQKQTNHNHTLIGLCFISLRLDFCFIFPILLIILFFMYVHNHWIYKIDSVSFLSHFLWLSSFSIMVFE